jgi:hypothetical protein
MNLKLRVVSFAVLFALASVFVFAPMSSAAKPPTPTTDGFSTAVTGTLSNATAFTGTATLLDFTNKNGVLSVVFSLTDAAGTLLGTFTAPIALTSGASCDILFLDIGPISLDLLGLTLDLSRITLDINAVPGAGNLLGNLLCAVAGLLDGGFNLDLLTDQLNILLDVLALLQL